LAAPSWHRQDGNPRLQQPLTRARLNLLCRRRSLPPARAGSRPKGWSWARIGKVVGLSDWAVGNIIATLPYDPKLGPPSLGETPKLGEP